MSELPTPPDAAGEVEVLRLWLAGEQLECSLRPDLFDDPGGWGAVLADVVRHVARAWQDQKGVPEAETVRRVLDVLGEELRAAPEDTSPER